MNRNIIYILLAFILVFSTNSYAEELWELTQPGNANIGQNVFVNQERLGLYIPKSFEGRRVNEDRTNFGLEIKNTFRFKHSDSEVNLKGMVNKMNFEYKTDIIDVQIFRSKNMKPGASACMDCHGSSIPRTLATIGYGQTKIDAYRMTHRGSKGVKALNVTEKNGNIVSFKMVNGDEDLIIITDSGMIIRMPLNQVSSTGRVAQGVKLINLKDNQKVSTIAVIEHNEESNNEEIVESKEENEE